MDNNNPLNPTQPEQNNQTGQPPVTPPAQPPLTGQSSQSSPSNMGSSFSQLANQNKSKLNIVIIIVVALALIGGGVFAATKLFGDKTKKTTSSGIEGLGGETTFEKSEKIGSTADLKDMQITVGALTKKSQFDKYTKADPGKEFVIASIKIVNNTQEKIEYPSYLFNLTTAKGEVIKSEGVFGDAYKKVADAVAASGETEGYIAFEVSKSDQIKSIDFEYQVTPKDIKKDTLTYKASFTE